MTTIEKSPIEILKKIAEAPDWHQNKIPNSAQLKWCVKAGKVSHEKATETLQALGWRKVEEEKWEAKTES